MKKIMFCNNCRIYTLKENCPICTSKTILAIPPKYSPKSKYDFYLRKAKEEERIKKGLI
ncbi:MAG: nucleolar RNA-binding Nop10p family protein [Candidatus Woesearchaeota archaeon]